LVKAGAVWLLAPSERIGQESVVGYFVKAAHYPRAASIELLGIPKSSPPSSAGIIGVERNRAGKLPRIQLSSSLANASQHGISILSKLIDLVNEIHKQELSGQSPRDVHPAFKLIDAATQIKSALPFLVVDNPFVVELRCTQPESVVKVWRRHDKVVSLKKYPNQFVLTGRGFAKSEFLRTVIHAEAELLQITVLDELSKVPIHRGRPLREILSTIDPSRP
jgi:hypothetical protein